MIILDKFKSLAKNIGNSGLYSYSDTMEEFYSLISGRFSEDMASKYAKQILN